MTAGAIDRLKRHVPWQARIVGKIALSRLPAGYGAIPDASVDFIWSQAVLEHIRRAEFPEFMAETRRVLKPEGVCSHRIDLKDHLGGSLHNLRFFEAVWESRFMSDSGFYTNRLRYGELLDIFRAAGFAVHVTDRREWNAPPIRRDKLAEPFRGLSEDDLSVSEFGVVLRPLRVH